MGVPRDTKLSIDFGGGNRLVVAVDQLDALIRGLEETREAIRKINNEVKWTRAMAVPPSQDPYSPEAMKKIIERTLELTPGTHASANLAYQQAVQSVLDKLIAAKKQYAGTEGVNQSIVEGKG